MDVLERIKTTLTTYPVVLFMKGTQDHPMCDFSGRAAAALVEAGVPFHAVNVLSDPQLRAGLPHYAHLSTFPQLYIHGELIGGCDVIEELNEVGELERIAQDVAGAHA
jgi:monothiol glutaredoxin